MFTEFQKEINAHYPNNLLGLMIAMHIIWYSWHSLIDIEIKWNAKKIGEIPCTYIKRNGCRHVGLLYELQHGNK